MNQLTDQRDLAESVYKVAFGQLSSARIEVTASGQVARVAGKAALPTAPVAGSRMLLTTVIAGVLGLVLSVLWFILWDWWHRGGDEAVHD